MQRGSMKWAIVIVYFGADGGEEGGLVSIYRWIRRV